MNAERIFVAILAMSVFSALAFDSETWLGKREVLTREAERLRAAYSNCVARLDKPVEDVTLPVEAFENGATKTVILAKKVQYFLDLGLVWGEGVTVRRFRQDGSVELQIEAQHCLVDRTSKSGWAEGEAKVTHGKTVFCGCGVYFSSPDSYVKVFERTEVDSRDLKFGEVRP